MSNIKNSVQLIGNIGKDFSINNFDSGTKKVNIVLATNDYYTNTKGEKVKKTEWHNLVAWGKTAELMANCLSKGNEIAIKGKLSSRSYEDNTGKTRYITEVIVDEFYKLNKEVAVMG